MIIMVAFAGMCSFDAFYHVVFRAKFRPNPSDR